MRQLHDSNGLAQMGQAWLAQLLLCVFDSLQQEQPGGYGAPGARATAAAKAATADLEKLLLLPLSDGSFATVDNQRQQPMYFPLDMDDSEGKFLPLSQGRQCICRRPRSLTMPLMHPWNTWHRSTTSQHCRQTEVQSLGVDLCISEEHSVPCCTDAQSACLPARPLSCLLL